MKSTARVLIALFFALSLVASDVSQPRRVMPREVMPSEIAKVRDSRQIVLHTAIFDPAEERPDYQSVGLGPARQRGEYAVLQLRSVTPAVKADLERLGVKFFGYLPSNAYQVRIAPSNRNAVAAHAQVRWVGDYEPGFKVHPRLWPSRAEEITAIRVIPFADLSVAKAVQMLKKANPSLTVTKVLDGQWGHFAEVAIPAGTADDFVRKASAIDGISWLEPNDQMEYHNGNSTGAIQGNENSEAGRSLFAHGLTGTGQIVAVADSGLDSDMCFFRSLNGVDAITDATSAITDEPGPLFPNRKVIGYWVQENAEAYDDGNADYHGTHTSGSVAGDDLAHPSSPTNPGIDPADGMAPNAQILFQDIGSNDGRLRGGDPYAMFLQAMRGGARVHSNSYGSGSKGAYTAYDQLVDQFIFDHDAMTVIFSAGNSGPNPTTTGSPGSAKNVISVGASNFGVSNTLALFSSRGPTADGRIKPDIIAPGRDIHSAGGDTIRGNSNCGGSTKQGTSMSAPTVAGGAALLRQYFAEGFYPSGNRRASDGFNASSALVKAVLVNGTLAPPTTEAFMNPKFGWGKIFLDNNLFFLGDTRRLRLWDLPNGQGLATGQNMSFTVNVASGQEFRATLVWNDPEGTPGAAKALVNDLDLVVTNTAGSFAGNVFNPQGVSMTGGSADRINNVEHVRFTAPVSGTYTITVNAASVPGNGRSGTDRQGFALVVSNAGCSTSVGASPSNLQARTNASRGVDLTWSAPSGATLTQVYRAVGASPSPADFRFIGTVSGTSFTDLRAQGGFTYSYMIRGADDCGEGPVSNAVTINAAGLCDLAPNFAGITSAHAVGTNCRILLSWGDGTSNCPLGNAVRYNIYRSTNPDFVPSGAPYATTTDNTYEDTNVVTGTTYYYVIRAEDTTGASPGPHGGNEEKNSTRLFATAFGPPGATGTWHDGAGDNNALMTPDVPWQISKAEAHTGSRSYHNGVDNDDYLRNTCASITTPSIAIDASAELAYFARYNLEWKWDGVIVEISEDNGNTWTNLPPNGGYPGTLADTQGPNGTEPPANACGYLATQPAFTGPEGNAALTPWTEYRSSLSAFAGKTVKIRWRFTSDPGLEYQGFYLDDISIVNAKMPGACIPLLVTPEALFDFVPGLPSRGSPILFRDRSLNAPTAWNWNFGDGGTSTAQNPLHTYANVGTYTVTLTVTNAAGTDTITRTVTVGEPGRGGKRRSAGH